MGNSSSSSRSAGDLTRANTWRSVCLRPFQAGKHRPRRSSFSPPRIAEVVVTPFLMRPVYPWDYDARGFEQTKDLCDAGIYSHGINYLGLPAGVVPVGFLDRLPAGIQNIGRRFREDLILDAMAVVERHVGVIARTL